MCRSAPTAHVGGSGPRVPAEASHTTPRLAFRLPLDPARLLRARERVRDYLHEHQVKCDAIDDVVLALEEAMTNAVRHSDAQQDLEVDLSLSGNDLVIEVRDHGRGFGVETFDPATVPDLESTGGRGLFLISRLTDEMELRCDGGLQLRALKRNARLREVDDVPERSFEASIPGSRAYHDERQRTLLDEIDEAFVAFDWEYRFTYMNAAFERLFARRARDLLGRTFWDIVPYAADHPAAPAYREAMELGRASVFEYESPAAGGWVETRVYPTSSGVSVYLRDVKARKRREQERDEFLVALKASEERYRAIVELADEELVVQADGTYSYREYEAPADDELGRLRRRLKDALPTAAAALRRHGIWTLLLALTVELAFLIPLGLVPTSRQVFGLPGSLLALTVVVTAAIAGWKIGLAAAAAGGLIFWAAVADFGAKSAPATTLVSVAVWMTAALVSGRLAHALREQQAKRKTAAVALARAETLRQAQLAEQQRIEGLALDLRRERTQLRAIIEQSDICIAFLDRDFDFLLVNSTYAEIYGYLPGEMVGLNHFAVHPDEESEATFRRVRDSGGAAEFAAKPFVLPDQAERGITYWDWRLAPVTDEAGRVEALVLSRADVTERVRSAMFSDALNAINAVIAARLDRDHILTNVLSMAGEALGCDAGNVATRENGLWAPTHVWRLPTEFLAERFTPEDVPYAELAVAEQRPVLLDDFAAGALGNPALARKYDIGSVAAIPLLAHARGTGCLFFSYRGARHSFSQLDVDFAEKVAAVLAQALENARLLRDTQRIATVLQENMIHPLPLVEGIELARVSQPAFAPDLVGGDFSDVMRMDDEHVGLLIGDVAGKGIQAAGLTETVRSAVFAYLATDRSPASVLDKTNRLLLKVLPAESAFVTACLVVVDLKTKTARVASAGHPPPLLVSSSCGPLELTHGVPLGTFACGYTEREIDLAARDCLVLYTDGVTEAKRDGELFGESRVAEALSRPAGATAQQMAELVMDAAAQFAGQLRDDLQVLVLRLP
jgi:PAS domain S-box-containing protein